MARYIDAEPFNDCLVVANKEDTGIMIRNIPTADVVSREEYERVVRERDVAREHTSYVPKENTNAEEG